MSKVTVENIKINSALLDFINNEAIPGTNLKIPDFWRGFDKTVHELAPINKNLINKRAMIQKKIDDWNKLNKNQTFKLEEYITFLKSIDYIVDEKEDFKITTSNVDKEIASIPGPQLVVPVDNARYALNAANARWGSLYDALYGTDVISENKSKNFDPERAKKLLIMLKIF